MHQYFVDWIVARLDLSALRNDPGLVLCEQGSVKGVDKRIL